MKYLIAGAAGLLLAASTPDLQANKALVEQFFRAVESRDKQTVVKIVREDYIQHMPNIPTGRAAILNYIDMVAPKGKGTMPELPRDPSLSTDV